MKALKLENKIFIKLKYKVRWCIILNFKHFEYKQYKQLDQLNMNMKKANSTSRLPSRSMSQIKIKINTALGNKNIRQVQISQKQLQFTQKEFIPRRTMSTKSLTNKCMTYSKQKNIPYAYSKTKSIITNNHNNSDSSSKIRRPSSRTTSIKEQISMKGCIQQPRNRQNSLSMSRKEYKKSQQKLIKQNNLIWFNYNDFQIQYIQTTVSKLSMTKQTTQRQFISYFGYNKQIKTKQSKDPQSSKKISQFRGIQNKSITVNNIESIVSFENKGMKVQRQNMTVFVVKGQNLKIEEVKIKQQEKNQQINIKKHEHSQNEFINLKGVKYVMVANKKLSTFYQLQKIVNQFIQLKKDGVQTFDVINKILNRKIREKIQLKSSQTLYKQIHKLVQLDLFVLIFEVCFQQHKKLTTAEIIQKKLTSFKQEQVSRTKKKSSLII